MDHHIFSWGLYAPTLFWLPSQNMLDGVLFLFSLILSQDILLSLFHFQIGIGIGKVIPKVQFKSIKLFVSRKTSPKT